MILPEPWLSRILWMARSTADGTFTMLSSSSFGSSVACTLDVTAAERGRRQPDWYGWRKRVHCGTLCMGGM